MPHLPHAPPCLHGNLSSPCLDPRPQAGLSAATPLSSSARSAFHPPSAANTSRWHPRQRERERGGSDGKVGEAVATEAA